MVTETHFSNRRHSELFRILDCHNRLEPSVFTCAPVIVDVRATRCELLCLVIRPLHHQPHRHFRHHRRDDAHQSRPLHHLLLPRTHHHQIWAPLGWSTPQCNLALHPPC